jgi:hypothetical protein
MTSRATALPYGRRTLPQRWLDGVGDLGLAVLLVLIPPTLFGILAFGLERIAAVFQ